MSSSVFLNNLDDFIAPSQACVNPLVASKLDKNSGQSGGQITLMNDFSRSEFDIAPKKPDLIKTKVTANNQKVASVSLNDCLACSGCVTSAETVLIQEQSFDKLLAKLNDTTPGDILVMISPNSQASFAAALNMSLSEVFLRVATVLKQLGIKYVVDASSAGDIALIEAREEFLTRLKRGRNTTWSKPPFTTANSASSYNVFEEKSSSSLGDAGTSAPSKRWDDQMISVDQGLAPVLTSNCPGWVCYAEKTNPQAIPYMSTVKSPQQIVGTLTKRMNKSLFVVSIQPCFDKKLEASRKDFYHSDTDEVEVDLVLSTAELWSLLESQAQTWLGQSGASADSITAQVVANYLYSVVPDAPHGCDDTERLFRSFSQDGQSLVAAIDANAGSGGYTEYVFKYAAQSLYGVDLWTQRLDYKEGRNPDMAEIDICNYLPPDAVFTDENKPKLKFARAYGFRNVQSIMLKLRRGQCDLDFVEVMACPSGCNNGGGQLKVGTSISDADISGNAGAANSLSADKERTKRLEDVFHSVDSTVVRRPDDSPLVQFVYSAAQLGAPLSHSAVQVLHTRYHAVPKLEVIAPLATKW